MKRHLTLFIALAACQAKGPHTTTSPPGTTPITGTGTPTTGSPTIPDDCTAPPALQAPTTTLAGPWVHEHARTRVLGSAPTELAGYEATSIGDVNGDGEFDVLLASQLSSSNQDNAGMAWVFYGPIPEGDIALSCADVVFEGTYEDDRLGNETVGVGDLTGDGRADIVLAAYRAADPWVFSGGGIVHVFQADQPGSYRGSEAYARLIGPNGGSMAGYDAVAGGDLTGDGQTDLLISSGQPHNSGALAWIAPGPLAGDIDLTTQIKVLDPLGDHAGDMGMAVADWNGDGQDDALIAFGNTQARTYAGPIAADLDVDAYDGRIFDAGRSYLHHTAMAGDVDGDGAADVLLCGAYADDGALENVGACGVVSGPLTGDRDVMDSPNVVGEVAKGNLGEEIAAGDFDGDGFSDVVISQSERGIYPRSGATFLFFGPVVGSNGAYQADRVWNGAYDGQMVGSGLGNVGDLDGDGVANLIVGAVGDVGRGPMDAGAWYLIDPSTL